MLAGDRTAPAAGAHAAESDAIGRVCFQPYPETEEQFIQRHFTQAFAVFSGKVSAMTVETARITVTRVWKGKLGAEVAMPTGTREMGNNVIMISGESFSFQTGEDYLIFGHGTSAETLSTSVCVPTGRLADSKRKIAVLDQIVARARWIYRRNASLTQPISRASVSNDAMTPFGSVTSPDPGVAGRVPCGHGKRSEGICDQPDGNGLVRVHGAPDYRAFVEDSYGRSVAVFSGTVVALDRFRATIRISRVWKGKLGTTVIMDTGARMTSEVLYLTSCDFAVSSVTGTHFWYGDS